MSQKTRIAVIDVNHWHSTYDAAYLNILRDLDDVQLVGVSDTDVAIANDRAQRYETTAFTNYREMLDTTKPDFVIALGRHIDMPTTARYLIEAGVPFLMEKPMGLLAILEEETLFPKASDKTFEDSFGRKAICL